MSMDFTETMDVIAKHNDLLAKNPKPDYQSMVDTRTTKELEKYSEQASTKIGIVVAAVMAPVLIAFFALTAPADMGILSAILVSIAMGGMFGSILGVVGFVVGEQYVDASQKHEAIRQNIQRELTTGAEVEYRTQLDQHIALREQAQQELDVVLDGTNYTYEFGTAGVKLVKMKSLEAASTPLAIATGTTEGR